MPLPWYINLPAQGRHPDHLSGRQARRHDVAEEAATGRRDDGPRRYRNGGNGGHQCQRSSPYSLSNTPAAQLLSLHVAENGKPAEALSASVTVSFAGQDGYILRERTRRSARATVRWAMTLAGPAVTKSALNEREAYPDANTQGAPCLLIPMAG